MLGGTGAGLIVRWRRWWRFLVSMAGGKLRNRFSGPEDPRAPVDTVLNTLVSEAPREAECDLTPMGLKPELPLPPQVPAVPESTHPRAEVLPIPPLVTVKPAPIPASPPEPASVKMALGAPHLGSGVACPVCGHLLALTIDRVLSGAPLFCVECGLMLTLDIARSRVGLEALKKLMETLGSPAPGRP
jgi:hypothetical protein